jgi:hypothetical protein
VRPSGIIDLRGGIAGDTPKPGGTTKLAKSSDIGQYGLRGRHDAPQEFILPAGRRASTISNKTCCLQCGPDGDYGVRPTLVKQVCRRPCQASAHGDTYPQRTKRKNLTASQTENSTNEWHVSNSAPQSTVFSILKPPELHV